MVGVIGKLKCTSYSLIFYEPRWVEVKLMIMDMSIMWNSEKERKKERINTFYCLNKLLVLFFFPGLINWFEKVGTTTNYKLYSNNKASLKTIYHIILLVDPCIAQFLSNSIQIHLIQSIRSILIYFGPFGQIQSIWSIRSIGLSLVNYSPIRSMSDYWV